MSEARLQTDVENYLSACGFRPRTHACLRSSPPRGWFIHLYNTRKNPILLDLLIISSSGRCLELELKDGKSALRPEQKVILSSGVTALARSFDEAVAAIREWMAGE